MKILICDDHALFRQGAAMALQELDDCVDVLEAHDGTEALAAAHEHRDLDLVLLDLQMPGMDGWTGLTRLRASYPALPIVILSASEEPRDARRAIEEGAAGYVPKSTQGPTLLRALSLILSGGVYLPPHLATASSTTNLRGAARSVADHAGDPRRIGLLTPKQLEVLRLMARGLRNVEIGDALGISLSTVKAHVTAIFLALDVGNRTEAALLMRQFQQESGD